MKNKKDNKDADDRQALLRTGPVKAVRTVIKEMLFLGFTVQILLGIFWMCRNFGTVQDFKWNNLTGEDYGGGILSLWGNLYAFPGQAPQVVYLLQLLLAFYAGYRFLEKHGLKNISETEQKRKVFAAWGSLALLTFPFAMQCHLAALPYSAMGSLFLLMLSFLLEAAEGRCSRYAESGIREQSGASDGNPVKKGRRLKALGAAALCGILAVTLAAAADVDEHDNAWGWGPEAALASRLAWSGMWYDYEDWPEELQKLTVKNLYEASGYPGNMHILLEDIAKGTDPETARQYYLLIAKTGWKKRSSAVIRQIGWDMLGYGVSPLMVPLQLEGRVYASYTGRNYEAMGSHTPVLTGYYVHYGCWWFGCCLILSALLRVPGLMGGGRAGRKALISWGICGGAAGIVVILYTLRGGGLMDYRCTVAVNQLWLIQGLMCIRSGR